MKYDLIIININFRFISFITFLNFVINSEINDNFEKNILEIEGSSILDVSDYINSYLLVSSSGNIYKGIPFSSTPISITHADLNSSSVIAVCNKNYILAACLYDHLLVKINIENGNFEPLVEYQEFSSIEVSDSSSCSLSIFINIIYIGISQPTSDNKIKNVLIKLNMEDKYNLTDSPTINVINKKLFIFPFEHKKTSTTRDISCEAVAELTTNEHKILCVYENIDDDSNKIVNLVSINFESEKFDANMTVAQSSIENGFRLYKVNDYNLRLVLRNKVYNVNLDSSFNIICEKTSSNLKSYNSFYHLFAYNNNMVLTFETLNAYYYNGESKIVSVMKIITVKDEYYSIFLYSQSNEHFTKLYLYYNDYQGNITITYQTENTIYYISLSEIQEIYTIISYNKILRVKSYESINYNVSNLIESSKYFGKLYIAEMKKISSVNANETITKKYPYDALEFPINKENQTLTLEPSENLWYELTFAFESGNNDTLRVFYLPNAKLSIRTCAFQCKSCSSDYYKCDSCRDSFAKKNSTVSNECFPIDHLIEGWLYDSNNNLFQRCYSTCKFCSKNKALSSSSNHNCLSCSNGTSFSYQYPGNCYKNPSKIYGNYSIVKYSEVEEFESVSFCTQLTIIFNKECVNSCPETNPYNYYNCSYFNYTEQEYGQSSESLCTITPMNFPKYKLGRFCYEECPQNSIIVGNECKCLYAWELSEIDNSIICLDVDYCINNNKNYYIVDTKQCNNFCSSETLPFLFYCFNSSKGCPDNYTLKFDDFNDPYCDINYKYCSINEKYQHNCSDEKNEDYVYQYYSYYYTKIYFKNCSESINHILSLRQTYLYNGICYNECPEEISIENDEKYICDCLYFGYYSEANETDYICYKENEKCSDYGQIPVNDLKICLDSIEKCIEKNYKIFNNECYNESCPENTEIKTPGDIYCLCKDYFYNNTKNELTCYDSSEKCKDNGFEYFNPLTKECFISLEDCYNKNNTFYFNKYCYKDECPSDYISLSSITYEPIKIDFINNLNLTDEYIINRTCVCDILNTNNSCNFTEINGVYLQEYVKECNEDYDPSKSNKCISSCLTYKKRYMFNTKCYYDKCPEGTKLKDDGTRNCICENLYYIDEKTNKMVCCISEDDINCMEKIEYPPEYYENPDNCPFVYNNTCTYSCPEDACLTLNDPNLIFCINTKSYMTVINGLCFTNFEDIIYNLKNISDNNLYIYPIPSIMIKVYTTNTIIDQKTSNFSYLELGNCENLLIQHYNLPNETLLYIVGIESPSKDKKSSVNEYSYGVYLENGTQLNLSFCEGEKRILYHVIINNSLIKLDEANYFSLLGYNIYKKNDKFYTDICSPAYIYGNDITLEDRKIDFYPSDVSFCNQNCQFQIVNLITEKIKCTYDISYLYNSENTDENENEEGKYLYSYSEFLLSLFNYKIIFCQKLLLTTENYLKNIGFYISTILFFVLIILMILNMTLGMRSLNQIIFENEPNISKLNQKIREKQKLLNMYENENKNTIEKIMKDKTKSNPQKKNQNIFGSQKIKKNKNGKKEKNNKNEKVLKLHLSANINVIHKFEEPKENLIEIEKNKNLIRNKRQINLYSPDFGNKGTLSRDKLINLQLGHTRRLKKENTSKEVQLIYRNQKRRLSKYIYLNKNIHFNEYIEKKELMKYFYMYLQIKSK